MSDLRHGTYRWPRAPRSFRRWLAWQLWRLKRWNKRQSCIAAHNHHEEDQGVFGVPGARVWWCRVCSHVEWID